MAEWPRAIKPEDRIKYLVNARAEVGIQTWIPVEGVLMAHSLDWRVFVVEEDGIHEAWYSSVDTPEYLLGEYDTEKEAKKALIDHLVVSTAVSQAWEDVAT